VWRQLDHKNIVPLYGTAYGFGFYPAMVCPWASKGSLNQYLHQCHGMLLRAEKFQVVSGLLGSYCFASDLLASLTMSRVG